MVKTEFLIELDINRIAQQDFSQQKNVDLEPNPYINWNICVI